MTTRRHAACCWALLLLSCLPAAAAGPVDARTAKADRARIGAERKALLNGFAAEERDCRERFVVTACVDDVHRRRRQALAPLRQRELQLDDAERSQRAAERRSTLAAKQQAATQRGPEQPQPAPELRVRKPTPPASGASAAAARAARHEDDSAARATDAAERMQAAQARTAVAQQTQQRIAQRQAQRQANGRVAQPLPAPDAASAAAARTPAAARPR